MVFFTLSLNGKILKGKSVNYGYRYYEQFKQSNYSVKMWQSLPDCRFLKWIVY